MLVTFAMPAQPAPPAPIRDVETLDNVIDAIDSVIQWLIGASSQLGTSPQCTNNHHRRADHRNEGDFEDRPRMVRFDVAFANRCSTPSTDTSTPASSQN